LGKHNHDIPNVLIFTHYQNLLLPTTNVRTKQEKVVVDDDGDDDDELLVLQQNIHNIIDLHPKATVRFLVDSDCEHSIRNALGNDTKLVNYFRQESQGMYKSDMCRGAALWETGGLYFDVDLGVRMSLWDVLGPRTSFVTVKVHERSKQRPGFFQAFIGATPHHPILRHYLELFVQYYEGKIQLSTRLLPDPKKHMLGVRLLWMAYQKYEQEQQQHRVTTKSTGIVELWHEDLYLPHKFPFIPEPTWGTENACKYLVVANEGWPPVVPLYSRIAGSRMCPPLFGKPPQPPPQPRNNNSD